MAAVRPDRRVLLLVLLGVALVPRPAQSHCASTDGAFTLTPFEASIPVEDLPAGLDRPMFAVVYFEDANLRPREQLDDVGRISLSLGTIGDGAFTTTIRTKDGPRPEP